MFHWPYLAPLIAVVVCALCTGSAQMIRTALALALNWVTLTAFVLATGVHGAWWLYLPVDALTAFVIMYRPAGKVQAVIGWTYMAQIMLHVVFATSNPVSADYAYWQVLTWIAFVQLALLGGWVGGHRLGFLDWGGSPYHARAHGVKGVARQ